jgi:hypothetical protein
MTSFPDSVALPLGVIDQHETNGCTIWLDPGRDPGRGRHHRRLGRAWPAGGAGARAIATEQGEYVGVRFQRAYVKKGDPLNAPQYMVFIVHDKADTGLADGFRAVPGIQPIRLPDAFGVTDLTLVDRELSGKDIDVVKEYLLSDDAGIDSPSEVNEITTFSVVFSPSGHLVIHEVRVRNRNGKSGTSTVSKDDTFNTVAKITDPNDPRGMFVQDDYMQEKLGPESSRSCFYIYSKAEFTKAYNQQRAWSGCLSRLKDRRLSIAPLTGTLTGTH